MPTPRTFEKVLIDPIRPNVPALEFLWMADVIRRPF